MDKARDKRGRFIAQESAPAATSEVSLVETSEVGAPVVEGTQGNKRLITVIEAGWGSSGYYSKDLLESDGPTAFPIGTHMYLNHPTMSEEMERPERDVRDLAAVLTSTPRMVGGELQAEAQIFENWRPTINALADHIGVSIRASGESEMGEAEGRTGPIITSLSEGHSVDFVTRAGAGGKVGQLIESARDATAKVAEARNVADHLAAHIHSRFSSKADDMFGDGYLTRDQRVALSGAVGNALDAFNSHIEDNVPELQTQDPYRPTPVAGQVDASESRRSSGDNHNQEADMADEKRLSELEESVRQQTDKVKELEESLTQEKTRADRAEDSLALVGAKSVVESAVKEAQGLPERAVERAVESALREGVPMDDGKLDQEKLKTRAVKAAEAERDYLQSAGGTGKPRGMGSSADEGTVQESEDAANKLEESFKRLGMSDDAAKVAAGSR